MKNILFIVCLLWATSCTQTVREGIQEHKQNPEAIAERQKFKEQLKNTKIDDQIVENFLAARKALKSKIDSANKNQTSLPENFVEKTLSENGFENEEQFAKMQNKISLVAMYMMSQDKKIKESVAKGKEELLEKIKDTTGSQEGSWFGNFVKEKIAENIDSLVKTGDLLLNFSVTELEELMESVNEDEKLAVKKQYDQLIQGNLHVQF